MNYNKREAEIYSELGIEGTTYEVSLKCLSKIIESAVGLCLDIGCGAGRVTRLVQKSAPRIEKVIGVDVNSSMLHEASKRELNPNISYIQIKDTLPFLSNSIDIITCANVLEEINSVNMLRALLAEAYRVLKHQSKLIIITANPEAIRLGANFMTYSYDNIPGSLTDGQQIICRVKGKKEILVRDNYWSNGLLERMLIEAGFTIEDVVSPIPIHDITSKWKDEVKVAPDNIWICTKEDQRDSVLEI